MKNEEAIKALKKLRAFLDFDYELACSIAIVEIEKSIPKKPKDIGKFKDLEVGHCPVCGYGVNNVDPYCSNCGQRIIFSEEE